MKTKNKKLQVELYKTIYLIRQAEQQIIDHYPEDEMKTPMHMSVGQEAIVAGVIQAAGSDAKIFGTYRSHAAYLAKTKETDKFFAELYGRATGSAHGRAGSMHLAAPKEGMLMSSAVVATTIPVAVGAALAQKHRKGKDVVISFFGDGAIHEGVFWESLNFACLKRLPVLFVCEDNDLAIHSTLHERAGHKSITQVVSQFYCQTAKIKTTKAWQIYQVTRNLLKLMKKSEMPGFLHAKYFRSLEHVGIKEDFDSGYRSKVRPRQLEEDSLLAQEKQLVKVGVSQKEISLMQRRIDRQIQKSITAAQHSSFPKNSEAFKNVYA